MMVSVVRVLTKQHHPEDQMTTLLLASCDNLPKSQQFRDDDAKRVCRRIVLEYGDAIVDGVSTGESGDEVCKSEGICDISAAQIQGGFKLYEDFLESQKKEGL
jgi:hypothetical protein